MHFSPMKRCNLEARMSDDDGKKERGKGGVAGWRRESGVEKRTEGERGKICHQQSASNEAGIKDRYQTTGTPLVLLYLLPPFVRFIALFKSPVSQSMLVDVLRNSSMLITPRIQILKDRQSTFPDIEWKRTLPGENRKRKRERAHALCTFHRISITEFQAFSM